ncbi:MAG: phosphohydrolase [Bdellovibrio sp. CG12_big_fil_rev_8_21_14_0_65_39_13]|nr:MAG: phosphohydrolase [Bdellovibrio sp. CG22_combo_CG10-13_8_21_14_all_39_27]PIQ61086.1 MAG: phosphohydrolase [Bdellovibrio sp. CG12_big_fil_rev_8_21_14_0_65_39_13]PIR36854.1 MAG: phosphohydrolase [Bdellovibrio sp. CG11_big_fil_rev_8_21_14_0_20_39_38]PJB53981.1 MAG: phosphohydrolase [Bdellovibrio sp. CG_4_9_14_3_um_filter_39_7]
MSKRFQQALELALETHSSQTRKGSEIPYISHVMAVSALAMELGGDEDTAIVALLHDVIEDSNGVITHQILRDKFGAAIADRVLCLSDATTFPKPAWKKRKLAYLENLSKADEQTLLVSACDKWHNLTSLLRDLDDIGDEVWERFSAPPEEQFWYYQQVYNAVCESVPLWLAERLEEGLDELEAILFDD